MSVTTMQPMLMNLAEWDLSVATATPVFLHHAKAMHSVKKVVTATKKPVSALKPQLAMPLETVPETLFVIQTETLVYPWMNSDRPAKAP